MPLYLDEIVRELGQGRTLAILSLHGWFALYGAPLAAARLRHHCGAEVTLTMVGRPGQRWLGVLANEVAALVPTLDFSGTVRLHPVGHT